MFLFVTCSSVLVRLCESAGKQKLFDRLKGHITQEQCAGTYGEVAADLGISAGAARATAHRMRARLGELIRASAGDLRRFERRFTMAHSLIYDEAEPFLTRILYPGGNKEDRERLLSQGTGPVGHVLVGTADRNPSALFDQGPEI